MHCNAAHCSKSPDLCAPAQRSAKSAMERARYSESSPVEIGIPLVRGADSVRITGKPEFGCPQIARVNRPSRTQSGSAPPNTALVWVFRELADRKSTRLNSSHLGISY